jgi:hypothetical protein
MKMNVCPHDKYIIQCPQCNGNSICIHGMIKSLCVTCIQAELCEHNKRKMRCPICTKQFKVNKCNIM